MGEQYLLVQDITPYWSHEAVNCIVVCVGEASIGIVLTSDALVNGLHPLSRVGRRPAAATAVHVRSVMATDKPTYEFYIRPPHVGKWRSFKLFLWNREEGQVFGRTGPSWAKIGLFYLIFYVVLAGLFAICLWVFFQTLDPRIPTWQLDRSIIGTSPGLGFRPMPLEDNVESTLIWYRGTDREDYKQWTESLDKFLAVYKIPGLTPGRGQNIQNCDYDKPPKSGQVCDVDIKNWKPCIHENHYSYHKSSPCIFIKLNKIYNWVPEYYNDTHDLPSNMPRDLKNHIRDIAANRSRELNTVWVSCQGENPADKENIGPITYIPRRGFPGYFYPYQNSEGYLSPIVAIHFERPRHGILINIECRAWARNIEHNRHDRVGMVHLELMID